MTFVEAAFMGGKKLLTPARAYIAQAISSVLFFFSALWTVALSETLSPSRKIFVVALMSLAILLHMTASIRYLQRSDEYISGLKGRRFVAACGLCLISATSWGIAESFGLAPHAPLWVVYPLFWGSFLVMTPLIRNTGREASYPQ